MADDRDARIAQLEAELQRLHELRRDATAHRTLRWSPRSSAAIVR